MDKLSKPHPDSILPQVRTLFGVGTAAGLTDGQLLERFARRRDEAAEAAFAALVARHGPMVLGLCRQWLGNPHDADDAFQATFLVLARKAGAIRHPELLGNWLYGVARRTAEKARRRISRRRDREGPGAMMSRWKAADATTADGSGHKAMLGEESEALHAELGRLPAKLRVAIVLCHLEGLTHDEAAQRLRIPVGTVRSRLARGRDRLRDRLSRRGLALPGVALAAWLTPRAAWAEVPVPLLEQTARAALRMAAGTATAGAVSVKAAELANDVLRSMLMNKLGMVAVGLISLGLIAEVGVLTASARLNAFPPAGQADDPQAGDRPATAETPVFKDVRPEEANWGQMIVTGRVLDPDGQPVAGARTMITGFPRHPRRGGSYTDTERVLGEARADAAGRIRMTVPRVSPWDYYNLDVIAGAEGFGPGWTELNTDSKSPEVEIRLRPEQVVAGRLVDIQGLPAAGVQVRVTRLDVESNGEFDGVGFRNAASDLPPWPVSASTDTQGRFALRGLGRDMSVEIQIRDDRFARQDLEIEPGAPGYPAGLVFAMKPAHIIEGRVTYADSGLPVPRARLAVMGGRYINGETDSEGRFRLNPYADSPYKSDETGDPLFMVFAHAPDGQPYLGLDQDLGWPKGAVRQTVEIALPRGTLVRGKVTDASSRKPLAGVQVMYMPRNDARPAEEGGRRVLIGEMSAVVSGDDGAYAIAIPPGVGHLVARGPSPEYILAEFGSNTIDYGRPGGVRKYAQAVVPVEAPRGSETRDVAIALRHGITQRGRVLDPDGQPVAAATLITRFNVSDEAHRWGGDKIPVRDGRFVLPGLEAGQIYRVLVIDSKLHWGAAGEISARESGDEPVIRLAPCGSARVRLVDESGKPIAHYRPVLQIVVLPGRFQSEFDGSLRGEDLAACAGQGLLRYGGRWGGPPTDADGRVTLSGLVPGATYRLLTSENDAVSLESEILKDFQVEPGQVLDLPDFTIKGDRAED